MGWISQVIYFWGKLKLFSKEKADKKSKENLNLQKNQIRYKRLKCTKVEDMALYNIRLFQSSFKKEITM